MGSRQKIVCVKLDQSWYEYDLKTHTGWVVAPPCDTCLRVREGIVFSTVDSTDRHRVSCCNNEELGTTTDDGLRARAYGTTGQFNRRLQPPPAPAIYGQRQCCQIAQPPAVVFQARMAEKHAILKSGYRHLATMGRGDRLGQSLLGCPFSGRTLQRSKPKEYPLPFIDLRASLQLCSAKISS